MPKSHLDLRDRSAVFTSLEDTEFDLLVIGAGITGAGVARDAAMRGLSVALVDARDFGAGTSSRSSKLVHGGMRYMEQGHLGIVREAARERKTLRRIAPHLALTMPVVCPAGSKAILLSIKAAVVAYEKLGQVAKPERHEVWDADELKKREPYFLSQGHAGAVVFPEYATDDARLTMGNVRSAVAGGAVVLNYAAVKEVLVENGTACGAVVEDTLASGNPGARIRARILVNAAGPWLDAVRKLEEPEAPNRLQLTKGIHVVLKRERLPVNNMISMRAEDRRGVFVMRRGEFAYLGTTDTFYPTPEYWPEIELEDVNYLLDAGSRIFDTRPFTTEDVVSLWSGVRPLLSQEGKPPSEISRRNEIMTGPAGVLSIAGGKLTSFRTMAQRVVDACEERLGRKPSPSRTADEPLPGGDISGGLQSIKDELTQMGLNSVETDRAAQLYGSEAPEVFAREKGPAAEAEFAVTREGAVTLEDYWVRRSARARFDEEGGIAALGPAAARMAELLEWTEAERDEQIEDCKARRARETRAIA
jgi:glycerol-3-phosphate dehydrogenase